MKLRIIPRLTVILGNFGASIPVLPGQSARPTLWYRPGRRSQKTPKPNPKK